MNAPKRLTDEEYNFIFDRVARLSIDLVITSNEGILLSLRDIEPFKGMWHLPGGMIYKNESVSEAAQRIARAETGLEVKIGSCIGYIEYIHASQDDHDRHTVSIVLSALPRENEPKTDYQAQRIQFHPKAPNNIIEQQKRFLVEHNLI